MTIIAPAFFLVLSICLSAVAALLTGGLGGQLEKAGPEPQRSKEAQSSLRAMFWVVTAAQIGAAGAWVAFGYVLGAP